MKRIFSILFAVVLVVSFSLIPATPVMAQEAYEVTVRLLDSNGNPLQGGDVRNSGQYFGARWTDENGEVKQNFTSGTTLAVRVYYNNTVSETQTPTIEGDTVLNFQTILLTLRLETCDETPLDGGRARYGSGGTYTTWWFPGGVTGSSAPGETTAEWFPGGTYSFQMLYKATADAKVSVVIPNGNTTLTWQTTKVTLYYSGSISYGGGSGDSTWFNKPSMELLPGTYWFHFRNSGRTTLTFSGCSFENAVSKSAWGDGDRFVRRGNWATFFAPADSPTGLLLEDGTLIGTVTVVSNGNGGLLVTYTITAAEVFLSQVHFHAATSEVALKTEVTNRPGNPMPGHFDHKFSFEWTGTPVTEHSFTIDSDSMSTFAAHAKVWVAEIPVD